MRYSVYLINFGYTYCYADSISAAISRAEQTGFECIIHDEMSGDIVGTYNPISGWHMNNQYYKQAVPVSEII
jgi:hypothetical protein